ncbi:hypothetical protein [Cloacibacillus evryensis]|uniref:hypothetical protein n=1 Tax=Cloacibacillus evryensis TaxID=508460 RepID=UPI00241DA09F|nr:hypothetical protein [Cloacibacillus evryensis]
MNIFLPSSKRRGAALIITVLISFILLSVLSLVAFNITVGRWQTEHYEEQRLLFLARSGAAALGAQLKKDYGTSGAGETVDKHGVMDVTDAARGFAASLDMTVSADAGAGYMRINVTARGPEGKSAAVSCRYGRDNGEIYGWDVK